jgi:DNA-binding MarR family transcriptional regulator
MLCFSLGVAMRHVNRIYGEALAEHEVTPSQLFLLSCLQQQDGLKPRDLAELVSLDTSSLTGLIDRTERVGLLQRQPDPDDRRALRIYLTDKGRELLDRLEPVVERLQERIHREFFGEYSAEQVTMFMNMLRQVQPVSA